jgi:hypothetical protein
MTYHDLREICDRYGLQVDFDITGQWTMDDPEAGPGYRLYVWEIASAWPIRVLGRIGLEDLRDMSYADMERAVVGCSVEAMGDAD